MYWVYYRFLAHCIRQTHTEEVTTPLSARVLPPWLLEEFQRNVVLVVSTERCHGKFVFVLFECRGKRWRWGSGTALQAWRSRVRFPTVSLEFFVDIILPGSHWLWGWLSLWQKWVPGIFPGGKGGRCVGLTTLPPSFSWNLGVSTFWNPQGLSRPVMGLLYFIPIQCNTLL